LLSPSLNVEIDTLETRGKTVIRVQIPFGEERPYSIDNTKIYVRGDDDTSMAIRDEIVDLVRQGLPHNESKDVARSSPPSEKSHAKVEDDVADVSEDTVEEIDGKIKPPRAGVEIVGAENRGDTRYYIMRDLRNGNIVKNVTQSSARRLWDYAIKQREANPVREDKVDWKGDIGLWRTYRKSGAVRYDLVQRNGNVRVYYGVTEGGMHGVWQQFLPDDQTE
jgi:hypothetical protein